MNQTNQYARRRYSKFKMEGLCVGCSRTKSKNLIEENKKALPGKSFCDDCSIANIWSSSRNQSAQKKYEPISMSKEDFIIWYKTKRDISNGLCEWCNKPFGKTGPVADHSHTTGEPRALVCYSCNLAEGFGIDRLLKIVIAIKAWETSRKTKPLDETKTAIAPSELIERSFNRWTKYINNGNAHTRESRLKKVVNELRLRCRSDEEVEKSYAKLQNYITEQENASV